MIMSSATQRLSLIAFVLVLGVGAALWFNQANDLVVQTPPGFEQNLPALDERPTSQLSGPGGSGVPSESYAQDPLIQRTEAELAPELGRRVYGRVEQAGTALPLEGVVVRVGQGSHTTETLTDGLGRFEVSAADDKEIALSVTHPDHVPLVRSTLPDDPSLEDNEWIVTLRPAGTIIGHVVGAGADLPGLARVHLWRWMAGALPDDPIAELEVDEGGRFSFKQLASGSYALTVGKEGAARSFETSIAVLEGQPTEVFIQLERGVEYSVFVHSRPDGAPIEGVQVDMQSTLMSFDNPAQGLECPLLVTGTDGRVRFAGLTPGNYRYWVKTPWGAGTSGFLDVVPGAPNNEERVGIHRPGQVSGRVIGDGGEPVANIRVDCRILPPKDLKYGGRRSGRAPPQRARYGTGTIAASSATDSQGRFVFRELPVGVSFVVLALETPDSNSTQARVIGRSGHVNLSAGEVRSDLIVSIPKGFTLSGRILDDQGGGIPGAQLSLALRYRKSDIADLEGRSAADGSFKFQGIPQGACRLDVQHPSYRDRRVSLQVEGDQSDLQVTLAPAHPLEGQVLDPEGWGIPGAKVRAQLREPVSKTHTLLTDEWGRFTIEGVHPGTWTLTARAAGFLAEEEDEVDCLVPQAAPVVLTLNPVEEQAPCHLIGEIVMRGSGEGPQGLRFYGYRSRTVQVSGSHFELTGGPVTRGKLSISSDNADTIVVAIPELVPGARVNLGRLETRRTVEVSVKVTNALGARLSDAEVKLERIKDQNLPEHITLPKSIRLIESGKDVGRYARSRVGMYKWRLVVRHKKWDSFSKEVKITGAAREFNVRLEKDRRKGGGGQ